MGVGGRVGLLSSEQEAPRFVASDRRQVGTRSGVASEITFHADFQDDCGFNDAMTRTADSGTQKTTI